MESGQSVSCPTIWELSTWNRKPSTKSTTRSALGCHPCLGYNLLPTSPGRTKNGMVEVRGETSNRNQRDGLAGGIAQEKMVEPRGIEPLTSTMPL